MVAQGATVAVLIASAGLSQLRFKDEEEEESHHEKQWQDIASVSFISLHTMYRSNDCTSSRSISHKSRRHPWDEYILLMQAETEAIKP